MNLFRSTWGRAGVAVTLAASIGGVGLAQAGSSGTASVFTPMTPCRLLDTRADSTVGDRATPLTEDETATFAGTGTNGDCTIPTSATALAANVTATGTTARLVDL